MENNRFIIDGKRYFYQFDSLKELEEKYIKFGDILKGYITAIINDPVSDRWIAFCDMDMVDTSDLPSYTLPLMNGYACFSQADYINKFGIQLFNSITFVVLYKKVIFDLRNVGWYHPDTLRSDINSMGMNLRIKHDTTSTSYMIDGCDVSGSIEYDDTNNMMRPLSIEESIRSKLFSNIGYYYTDIIFDSNYIRKESTNPNTKIISDLSDLKSALEWLLRND